MSAVALYASSELEATTARRWELFEQTDYNFSPRTFVDQSGLRDPVGQASTGMWETFGHPHALLWQRQSSELPVSTILLILLVLLLVGALPSWPYSRSWGYGPSGLLGLVVVVLIILLLLGRI
jgi:hypothetical protein